jgi:hypothetical protein
LADTAPTNSIATVVVMVVTASVAQVLAYREVLDAATLMVWDMVHWDQLVDKDISVEQQAILEITVI